MVNETVLKYLLANKDKYKLDDLKKEVMSKHYTEEEYYEALKVINDRKFKSGELSKLPDSNVVEEKKKSTGLLKLLLIIFLIILFGVGVVVLFNYLGFDFFGFNLFEVLGLR